MRDGCAYGKVSRQMIIDIAQDVKEIKQSCASVNDKIDMVGNHYSSRLPTWASVIFGILLGIMGVLVGLKI